MYSVAVVSGSSRRVKPAPRPTRVVRRQGNVVYVRFKEPVEPFNPFSLYLRFVLMFWGVWLCA